MDYYDLPSLFVGERCNEIPFAYFGGPWLPMFNTQKFVDYTYSVDYPLQILENKSRREGIVEGLISVLPTTQLDLFSDERSKVNSLLDDLLVLGKDSKPLYAQWSQKIGNKVRNLSKAKGSLDTFLRDYVLGVVMQAPSHKSAHGGEKGWSVKKSLETHLPMGNVLSFDLQNCFDNVTHQYIFDFYYNFFDGKVLDSDLRRDLSGFLTNISSVPKKSFGEVTYSAIDEQVSESNSRKIILKDHVLPQGSPISIQLFNRLFYPIDSLFCKKAKQKGLRYSRWVDDIIISSPKSSGKMLSKFLGALHVTREDFPVAVNKVFWQYGLKDYYLLGHKISEDQIIKVDKEEMKKGELVSSDIYGPENKSFFDDWIDGDF